MTTQPTTDHAAREVKPDGVYWDGPEVPFDQYSVWIGGRIYRTFGSVDAAMDCFKLLPL